MQEMRQSTKLYFKNTRDTSQQMVARNMNLILRKAWIDLGRIKFVVDYPTN